MDSKFKFGDKVFYKNIKGRGTITETYFDVNKLTYYYTVEYDDSDRVYHVPEDSLSLASFFPINGKVVAYPKFEIGDMVYNTYMGRFGKVTWYYINTLQNKFMYDIKYTDQEGSKDVPEELLVPVNAAQIHKDIVKKKCYELISNVVKKEVEDNMKFKFDEVHFSSNYSYTYPMTMPKPKHKEPFFITNIKKVIFNPPCTVVLFGDGTKEVVRCQDGEVFDPEKGFAMALCKRYFGSNKNHSNYYELFTKFCPKEEPVVDNGIEDYALCAFNFGKDEKKNNVEKCLKEMPEELRNQIFDVLLKEPKKEVKDSNPCTGCSDRKTGCLTNCQKMQDYVDNMTEEPKKSQPIEPGYFIKHAEERKDKPKKVVLPVTSIKDDASFQVDERRDDTGMIRGVISFVRSTEFTASMFPSSFLAFCRKHDLYFYIVDEVKGGLKKVDPWTVNWQQVVGYLKRGLMESCKKTKAGTKNDRSFLAVDMHKAQFSRLPLELRKANRKEDN